MTARLLLVARNFPPITGGASRLFGEIYRHGPPGSMAVLTGWAADQHVDPDILRWSPAATAEAFGGAAVPVLPFAALRELRAVVRERRIDRILAGKTLIEGWLALAVRLLDGVSYDCFTHGEEINTVDNGERVGFLASRRYRLMTRLVLGAARRVIANSEYTAAILREQWAIDASRIRVLKPGVDCGFFTPDSCGTPPFPDWQGRRVVLAAGRLQARKGYDVAIRAVAALRDPFPDILLVIAGAGEEEVSLRALVDQLAVDAHVTFTGAVGEELLRACYRHCDVFVLANRQIGYDVEGFGMVLLEAQACGAPVIAGRSGGAPETLIEGETGLVVDCTAPDALAVALAALLGDASKRSAMGSAARRSMEERFDWNIALARAPWLFEENTADGQ